MHKEREKAYTCRCVHIDVDTNWRLTSWPFKGESLWSLGAGIIAYK